MERLEKLTALLAVALFLGLTALSFFYYEIPNFLWLAFFACLLLLFGVYTVRKRLFLYTAGRLMESLVTLFVVATVTFLLLRLLPGGPFDREKSLPPEIKANIEAKYHLDKPLAQQYWLYIKGLTQGQLGFSYKYTDRSVGAILKDALPVSVQLGVYALLLAFALGVPLGVFAARRAGTLADTGAMMFSVAGLSLPSFVLAPLLILFFAFKLRWLEAGLWEGTLFFILPAFVLGIRPTGVIARLIRSSLLDFLASDYVRTARAKGLSESVVFYKHILKNAFLPVLTFSGPLIAGVLTGSFVIEKIFAIPGMGQHFVNSVTNRDYPLILGALLVYSSLLIVSNMVVDLLYAFFDPRIQTS